MEEYRATLKQYYRMEDWLDNKAVKQYQDGKVTKEKCQEGLHKFKELLVELNSLIKKYNIPDRLVLTGEEELI